MMAGQAGDASLAGNKHALSQAGDPERSLVIDGNDDIKEQPTVVDSGDETAEPHVACHGGDGGDDQVGGRAEPEGRWCDGRWVGGGRVHFGADLSPQIRELVEERRRTPAQFASTRNLRGATLDELAVEEMPQGLFIDRDERRRRARGKRRKPVDRLFKGMSIGAFMFQIVRIHPHILPTAFCATLAAASVAS